MNKPEMPITRPPEPGSYEHSRGCVQQAATGCLMIVVLGLVSFVLTCLLFTILGACNGCQ